MSRRNGFVVHDPYYFAINLQTAMSVQFSQI